MKDKRALHYREQLAQTFADDFNKGYRKIDFIIKKAREEEREKVMLFLSNLKEDTSAVYALYLLRKLKAQNQPNVKNGKYK